MIRALLLLVLLACSGHAATWYVSTTGNDSTGTGSEGNPWRTIRKGLDSMASGDTLLLRGGTYEEDPIPGSSLKNGVNNSQRTIIASYPGERAVFRPPTGHGISAQTSGRTYDYITFSGWTIDMARKTNMDASLASLKMSTPNFLTFTNMHFLNNTNGSHLQIYPVEADGIGQGLHVVDCVFSNSFIVAKSDGTMPSAVHPFYTRLLPGTIVERSRFYNGHSTGTMTTSQQTNWVVRFNYYTNYSHGLHWRGINGLSHNNIIVDSGRGIRSRGLGNRHMNNTVIGFAGKSEHGVEDYHDGAGTVDGISRDEVFVNNIAYGHFTGSALYVDSRSGARISYWTNNIAKNLSSSSASREMSFTASTVISGNIAADPLFVDFGTYPDGLKIQETSPARAYAVALTSLFTTDYAGATRTEPWDDGAYALDVVAPAPLPLLTIAADGEHAFEATLTPQTFTVTREGSTSGALNVNFTVGGTATAGTHYTALSSPLALADGASTGTLTVQPLASGATGDTTVVVTLAAGDYTLGGTTAATITIVHATSSGGLAAPGRLRGFGPL